ncbi:MAG TPA: heavy metal-associated domain-containing protein [Flavipsychrobacter sp.]
MLKKILSLLGIVFIGSNLNAQSKVETINVKTSIYCDHCKKCESCGKRLEEAVYKEKGVKRVDIDEKTKVVTISYNTTKTNPEQLRQAIASVGFDADNVKGDEKAYMSWDNCCKK